MKRMFLLLFAGFSLVAATAQTADEIVNKHLEAIGGAANWKKVTSVVQTGTMSVQGAEIQVVATVLHQVGSRQDITLMGMTGYQIVTTTEGWSFMPFQGAATPEAMTPEDVKDGQEQLDAQGSLVDYAAKGHKVEYLGKEDVDGTECHKLLLTLKSGKSQTLFVDPKTFFLVKSVNKRNVNGQEVEVSTSFSDYKKLPEGIVVPMSVTVPLGPGMDVDMQIEKVEINAKVDASLFKPAK
ncbi:MAG TPA: hypothetical protein PKE07_11645 [Lacibacter sp.]|nr:hypothetical protein [Lacibacter sp.]HMO88854.1 hypothetical protein [Lacibacter sp.]